MDPADDNHDEMEVTTSNTDVSKDLEINESPLSDNNFLSHSKVSKVSTSEDELVKIFSQQSAEPFNNDLERKSSDNKTGETVAVIDDANNELEAELEQSVFCLEKILSEDDGGNLEHGFCEEILSVEPDSVSDENMVSEVDTVESIVESDEDINDNIDTRNILAADEASSKLNESIDQASHDQLIDEFEVIEKEVTDENNQLLKVKASDDVNNTMSSNDSDWETEEEILVTEVDDEELNKMAEEMLSKSLLSELEQDVEDALDIDRETTSSNPNVDWLQSSMLGEGSSPASPFESSKDKAVVDLLAISSFDPQAPTCIPVPLYSQASHSSLVKQIINDLVNPDVPNPTSEPVLTSPDRSSPNLEVLHSILEPVVPSLEASSMDSIQTNPSLDPVSSSNTLLPTLELEISSSPLDPKVEDPTLEAVKDASEVSPILEVITDSNTELEVDSSTLTTTLKETTPSQTFESFQSIEDLIASSAESCSCSTDPIFSVSTLSHLSSSDKEFGWSNNLDIETTDLLNDMSKDTETNDAVNDDSSEPPMILEDFTELPPKQIFYKPPEIIIKEELIDGNVIEEKSTPGTPSCTPTKCTPDGPKTDLLVSLLNSIKDKEGEGGETDPNSDEPNTQIEPISRSPMINNASNNTEVLVRNESDEHNTPITPTSTPTKCVSAIPKSDILKSLLENIRDEEAEEETSDQMDQLFDNEERTKIFESSVQDANEHEAADNEIEDFDWNEEDQMKDFHCGEDKPIHEADAAENVMQKSVQSDVLKKMIVKETNILHSSTEKLEIDSSNDVPEEEDTKLSCNFLKPKIQVEPDMSDCSDFAEERKPKSRPLKLNKKKKGKKSKNKKKLDLSQETLARNLLPMRLQCEESEILQELLTPVYSSQESLYSSQSTLHTPDSHTPKSRSHQNLHLIPPAQYSPRFSSQDNLVHVSDCTANFETMEDGGGGGGKHDQDSVPCEPLASLSLEGKMSVPGSAWFPWKTMSFILLIATAAIINIDVNKHGNFKRSNTGQFMKDIGQYERSMAAYQLASTSLVTATVMAKEYGTQGYNMARKHAGPTMDLVSAKVSEASAVAVKYGVAGMENAREVVKAGVDKVGVMLPGLEDQAKVYWLATKDLATKLVSAVSQGWKDVTSGNVEIDWDGLKTGAVEKAVYLQKQLEQVLQWAKDQINTLVK